MFKTVKRLIFLIAVFSLFAIPVYADDSAHYQQLMSTQNGTFYKYYATQQPDDALVLANNVTIGTTDLTKNYDTGVINLPRLKYKYYYVFSSDYHTTYDTYGLKLGDTIYPTLSWTAAIPGDTEFGIQIRERGSDQSLETAIIVVNKDVQLAPRPTDFKDCSKDIMKLLANSSDPTICKGTDVREYPAAAHKACIVSSNVVAYCTESLANAADSGELFQWVASYPKNIDMTNSAYPGSKLPVDVNYTATWSPSVAITRTSNMMNAIEQTNISTFNTDVVCFFSDTSCIEYNSNTLDVTSKVGSSKDVLNSNTRAMYAVAYGNNLVIYRIDNTTYSGNFVDISASAEIINCSYGEPFNIFSAIGKTDLDLWANDMHQKGYFNTESYPAITYIQGNAQDFNVYRSSIAYDGVIDHCATLKAAASKDSVIFNLYYKLPESSDYSLLTTLPRKINDTSPITQRPTEIITDYVWDGWYTDTGCRSEFDIVSFMTTNIESKVGKTTNLYSQYTYDGGTYTVQFYNDYKKTYSSGTFETREYPTLPTNPTRPGYKFKEWIIVSNIDDETGVTYDPVTFKPERGKSYLFKTTWSASGIIVDVTTTKESYYVGDSIDKSAISVVVQTDDLGSTKTLANSDFSIKPTKCEKAGSNKIKVTYTTAGTTATFTVNGVKVKPNSITATYNGSSLRVGDTIPKGNITVKANMNNGTTKTLSQDEFSISPTSISASGSNSITVTYQDCTTTFNITGNSSSSSSSSSSGSSSAYRNSSSSYNSTSNKTLLSISAVYRGKLLKVSDKLANTDFTVTARYADGSSNILQPTEFTLTPDYIRNAGANSIVITYSGKTCTITLQASENEEAGTGTSGGSGGTKPTATPTATVTGTPSAAANPGATTKGNTGYLGGSNVLSNRMYTDTNTSVNEVDIAAEIDKQTESGSTVTVTLYNSASGNDITPEIQQKLIEKKATLIVTMIDPTDKVTKMAEWVFDGNTISMDNVMSINPNVTFRKQDKDDGMERVTFLNVLPQNYYEGVTVKLFPPASNYEAGESVALYSVDSAGASSRKISDLNWSASQNDMVTPKLTSQEYYFALSNAASAYPDDSDLTLDTLYMDEEEEEEEEEPVAEESFDWEDDSGDVPLVEQPVEKPKSKKGLLIGGLIALIVAALAAMGIVGYKIIKGKSNDGFDEDEDEDDESEDSDESEDEGDIFDDDDEGDAEEEDEEEEEEE